VHPYSWHLPRPGSWNSPAKGDWFLEFSLLFTEKSIHSAEVLLNTAFPYHRFSWFCTGQPTSNGNADETVFPLASIFQPFCEDRDIKSETGIELSTLSPAGVEWQTLENDPVFWQEVDPVAVWTYCWFPSSSLKLHFCFLTMKRNTNTY
jgi:hypothetical protein